MLTFCICGVLSEWIEKHDMSRKDFDDQFTRLTRLGYKLSSVCAYDEKGRKNYVAYWERNIVRGETIFRLDMTADELRSNVSFYMNPNDSSSSYALLHICPYVSSDTVFFSAIWEKRPANFHRVLIDKTRDQIFNEVYKHVRSTLQMKLTLLNAYVINGQELYVAVLEQFSDNNKDWQYEIKMTEYKYRIYSNFYESRGYRPKFISGYELNGTPYFSTAWEKITTLKPIELISRHYLNSDELELELVNLRKIGFKPRYISSFSSNSVSRFNLISEKVTTENSSIKEIDQFMIENLGDAMIYGLNLAITKNEKLVYEKAYGRLDSSLNDPLSPDNSVRIGGISKMLTALGIMKLYERGVIKSLDQKVFGPNGIFNDKFSYAPYNLEKVKRITVRSLLTHTSGLRGNSFSAYDELNYRKTTDPTELIDEYLNYPYLFSGTPGNSTQIYSNIGYLILGGIIEYLSGKKYENFIRENILEPCEIGNSMFIGASDGSSRLPEEVFYTPIENLNAHAIQAYGGWVARAQDLAKIMVRIDGSDIKPDIVSKEILDLMKPSDGKTYGMGLMSYPLSDNYGHDGSLGMVGSTARVLKNDVTYALIGRSAFWETQKGKEFIENFEKLLEKYDRENSWTGTDLFETVITQKVPSSQIKNVSIFPLVIFLLTLCFKLNHSF